MAGAYFENDWRSVKGTLVGVSSVHYVKERETYNGAILINPSERFATVIEIAGNDGNMYEGTIWDVVANNYVGKQVELREKPVTFDFAAPEEEPFSAMRPVTLVQRLYSEGNLIFESMVELLKVKEKIRDL